MRRRRWPLRYRLAALVIALLAAVGAVIGVVSTLALRSSLLDQLDNELTEASARAFRAESPTPSGMPPGLEVPGQGVGTVLLFIRNGVPAGGYITPEGAFERLTRDEGAALLAGAGAGISSVDLGRLGTYRVIGATTPDGTLQVTGLSTAAVDATVQRHVITTVAVTLTGLLLGGLFGVALVRRELRQLDRVAATATRVAQLPLHRGEVDLSDRVPEADTDPSTEVGKVGAALNQLLGHVENALAARQASETQVRRFVADASHELRTPLASIRGYAELVRRVPEEVSPDVLHAVGRVESEAVRMTTLVEDLLLLARLDAGRSLEREPVDLTALAADAVADAHAAGPDHAWRLVLPDSADVDDEPTEVLVLGDDHALRQVLANLLSNARVHTPAGTTVTTSISEHEGAVLLSVRDDGPGIQPDLQERLFDRFSRGDAARSPGTGSTGLGLAIADAVVRAHGGHIEVDGTPGATTFTVTFPVAQPAPPEQPSGAPEVPTTTGDAAPTPPPQPPPPPAPEAPQPPQPPQAPQP